MAHRDGSQSPGSSHIDESLLPTDADTSIASSHVSNGTSASGRSSRSAIRAQAVDAAKRSASVSGDSRSTRSSAGPREWWEGEGEPVSSRMSDSGSSRRFRVSLHSRKAAARSASPNSTAQLLQLEPATLADVARTAPTAEVTLAQTASPPSVTPADAAPSSTRESSNHTSSRTTTDHTSSGSASHSNHSASFRASNGTGFYESEALDLVAAGASEAAAEPERPVASYADDFESESASSLVQQPAAAIPENRAPSPDTDILDGLSRADLDGTVAPSVSGTHSATHTRHSPDQPVAVSVPAASRIPRPRASPARPFRQPPSSIHSGSLGAPALGANDDETTDASTTTTTTASSVSALLSLASVADVSSHALERQTGHFSRPLPISLGRASVPKSASSAAVRALERQVRDLTAERAGLAELQKSQELELAQLRRVSDEQAAEVVRLARQLADAREREAALVEEKDYLQRSAAVRTGADAPKPSQALSELLEGGTGERVGRESLAELRAQIAEQEHLLQGYQIENERLVAQQKRAALEKKTLEQQWAARLDALLVENAQLQNAVEAHERATVQHPAATREQDTSISGISAGRGTGGSSEDEGLRAPDSRLARLEARLRARDQELANALKAASASASRVKALESELAEIVSRQRMPSVGDYRDTGIQTLGVLTAGAPATAASVEAIASTTQTTAAKETNADELAALRGQLETTKAELGRQKQELVRERAAHRAELAGDAAATNRLRIVTQQLRLFEDAARRRFGAGVGELAATARKRATAAAKGTFLPEERVAELEARVAELQQEAALQERAHSAAVAALRDEHQTVKSAAEAKAEATERELEDLRAASRQPVQQDRFLARLDELWELLTEHDVRGPVVSNVFKQLRRDVERLHAEAAVSRRDAELQVRESDQRIRELELAVKNRQSEWTHELRAANEQLQRQCDYLKQRVELLVQARDAVQESSLKMLRLAQHEAAKVAADNSERALALVKRELQAQAAATAELKTAALQEHARRADEARRDAEARVASQAVVQNELRDAFRAQEREWTATIALLRDECAQLQESLRRARVDQPPGVRQFEELVDRIRDVESRMQLRHIEAARVRDALAAFVHEDAFSNPVASMGTGGLVGAPSVDPLGTSVKSSAGLGATATSV